ncbi:MAG: diguanylate cyclase [Atopobiaceae bacterium]|nr:diguanylate cyclase [Atopobiaceae bacterium]
MKDKQIKQATGGISIRVIGGITVCIAALLALYAFTLAERVDNVQKTVAQDETRNIACRAAIDELQTTSDFLTSHARMFVVTGNRAHLDAYLDEINVTNRRAKDVEVLRTSFSPQSEAARALERALDASDALAQTELAAMSLAAGHYGLQDVPDTLAQANVDAFRLEGDERDDLQIATDLVLGASYDEQKDKIREDVEVSSNALLSALEEGLDANETLMQSLLLQLRVTVALLLCVIMVLVLALFMYVLKPIGGYIKRIRSNEPLEEDGAYELHYLAHAYNEMYEDNVKRIEQLRAFAERDPLTGISNRSGYDSFLATHTRDIALLLIDVDNFREYNNVYGRDVGDALLARLATALVDAFRSTDFPCRIENDEFAVIMTNMSADLRGVIESKVEHVNAILAEESEDLPLVTLSVGAAFSTEGMSDQDIYRAAGTALSRAKQSDTNSIVFYGEGYGSQAE